MSAPRDEAGTPPRPPAPDRRPIKLALATAIFVVCAIGGALSTRVV